MGACRLLLRFTPGMPRTGVRPAASQGITTSADADDSERFEGRAVVVVAWYFQDAHGNNQGSRITLVDLATLRYRHVLLSSRG